MPKISLKKINRVAIRKPASKKPASKSKPVIRKPATKKSSGAAAKKSIVSPTKKSSGTLATRTLATRMVTRSNKSEMKRKRADSVKKFIKHYLAKGEKINKSAIEKQILDEQKKFVFKSKDLKGFKELYYIAQGSFGSASLLQKNDKLFVLKTLKDPNDIELIIPEYITLTTLQKHFKYPYIPTFYSLFKNDNDISILMDYLSGLELSTFYPYKEIDIGHVKKEFLDNFISQVGCGIYLLHKAGYIHGDLKQANIIYQQGINSFVIIDYGTTCNYVFKDTMSCPARFDYKFTTPNYASPDMTFNFKKMPNNLAQYAYLDLWSFGVILYELYYEKAKNISNNELKHPETINLPQNKKYYNEYIENILYNIFNNKNYTFSEMLNYYTQSL